MTNLEIPRGNGAVLARPQRLDEYGELLGNLPTLTQDVISESKKHTDSEHCRCHDLHHSCSATYRLRALHMSWSTPLMFCNMQTQSIADVMIYTTDVLQHTDSEHCRCHDLHHSCSATCRLRALQMSWSTPLMFCNIQTQSIADVMIYTTHVLQHTDSEHCRCHDLHHSCSATYRLRALQMSWSTPLMFCNIQTQSIADVMIYTTHVLQHADSEHCRCHDLHHSCSATYRLRALQMSWSTPLMFCNMHWISVVRFLFNIVLIIIIIIIFIYTAP